MLLGSEVSAKDLQRVWKPGSIWRVSAIEVLPGKGDGYVRMPNTVWKAQRVANQKSDHEKSCKIM